MYFSNRKYITDEGEINQHSPDSEREKNSFK
jgi:hypothetical protein